ncbi:MAG: hypothetical protein IJP82_06915 [Bacteroidaceae bacterium]|nr:hypothetical protein [Bacteroidaceae bacterium]
MSIAYRKVKRQVINPDHTTHEAWLMQQVCPTPVSFEDFVKECMMSQGVAQAQVKGIACAMSDRLRHYLSLGHSVQIGGIGTLRPVFNATSAESAEQLSAKCIHSVKVRFYPHKEFQETLKKMEFEDVEMLDEEE